jgi:hypothetical protein
VNPIRSSFNPAPAVAAQYRENHQTRVSTTNRSHLLNSSDDVFESAINQTQKPAL